MLYVVKIEFKKCNHSCELVACICVILFFVIIRNLSEEMLKHCSHCTTIWGKVGRYYVLVNESEKRYVFSLCLNADSVADGVTSRSSFFPNSRFLE